MTVNLDPAAAIGFITGSPPLIGASLALIGMLVLWLVSKLLKFAQMGLGAVAVVFLVRLVMSGGADAVPSQEPAVAAPSKAMATSSLIGGGELQIDSSGLTFHVPFGANQPIDALQQSNQAQVQRAMAAAVPIEALARN
jgi:hypothetical protein